MYLAIGPFIRNSGVSIQRPFFNRVFSLRCIIIPFQAVTSIQIQTVHNRIRPNLSRNCLNYCEFLGSLTSAQWNSERSRKNNQITVKLEKSFWSYRLIKKLLASKRVKISKNETRNKSK